MTAGSTEGGAHVLPAAARYAASLPGSPIATRRSPRRPDAPELPGVRRRRLRAAVRRGHLGSTCPTRNPPAAPVAANRRLPERDLPRVRRDAAGSSGELAPQD